MQTDARGSQCTCVASFFSLVDLKKDSLEACQDKQVSILNQRAISPL